MPPGQNMDDWLTCFRSGMWRLQYGFKMSAEGHKRYFREFVPLLHETKHEVLGDREDESWYLVYIGTKPHARGKGYARALIESVTKKVSICFTARTVLQMICVPPEASPNQSSRDPHDSQRYGSMHSRVQIPHATSSSGLSPNPEPSNPKRYHELTNPF